ncbi:hypothetical protein BD324DRAFT_649828 [Kockovaella imperatae]|uniref:Uncharacterized protein n=1 Tax=Kockovaella imperatae TaxID=4999 RepID=A0A1Y1UKF6_9TREE|nr:hypothetical protein BD324DRAFT_649828 [Kockovaella imperatae]ORX38462.1 hypothetical protein BD324DRAFT_649828 [Kockovaella imperatae]
MATEDVQGTSKSAGESPNAVGSSEAPARPRKSKGVEPNSSREQYNAPFPSPLHPSSSSTTSDESSSLSPSDSTRKKSLQGSRERQGSSTPSTSVFSTPDDPKSLTDPFQRLSVTDAENPVGSLPDATPSEPVSTPSTSMGVTTPSSSAPSVVSSSEAHDLLGPLPPSQYAVERASSSRQGGMTLSSHGGGSGPRLPLPSPPASWGISELISGSPYHTAVTDSYFAPMQQSDTSQPSRTGSSSRRPPAYSPFRTYYGENSRPSSHQRPLSAEQSLLFDGTPSPSSVYEIYEHPTPKPPSDPASSPSHESRSSRKSPRVRNVGPVLAPHGSFTSTKSRRTPPGSTRSSANSAVSDPQQYAAAHRNTVPDGMTPDEADALRRAAAKGDQLAMYRLGWRADTPLDKRYVLGSVEDVWGSVSPYASSTRRSSKSSHSSGYFGAVTYSSAEGSASQHPPNRASHASTPHPNDGSGVQ